jgi:hypothetical protein
MNELTKNIIRASNHKTLLFLILVMTLAAVADRYCMQEDLATIDSNQLLAAGLPSHDGAPGNRAGNSAPSDDGAAAQLVQFIMPKDNGPGRTKFRDRTCGRSSIWTDKDSQNGALKTTAPMIDTKLGRQFTLVGARPSGTS